ncbi:MAG: hypothetical protein WDO15_12020 [Bacteroidota bacterium]
MKRLVSILLIIVFLFNVIGYYGIYMGMKYRANTSANHAIENGNYDQSKTLTLKVPLMLPYVADKNFEYVTGDFEHKGDFYKLVGSNTRATLFI